MDTSFLDEGLDMIEVLDRPALFSNGRIPRAAVPEGLYAYDLYESCDTGNFCYIAPLVVRCWSKNPLTSAARTESI